MFVVCGCCACLVFGVWRFCRTKHNQNSPLGGLRGLNNSLGSTFSADAISERYDTLKFTLPNSTLLI